MIAETVPRYRRRRRRHPINNITSAPLTAPSDNTAAKMGKNEQQQPSKQHLPIATAPTAKSSATAKNN
eukprot:CAMPEP_0201866750 /NCGR_PEP_ID=MMETSP0902-20130614/1222_1 /ASSEMBLY_ACC=CAM_ASM_000551 /TAXON_ID=420261 /ORGANISM="Thalassiosira antarctica, Strain CCMP982" /LENGTH=67 /DNA_ID=CAMNT_0048391777 /DNA_START=13 /DNA_END=215 /DNA_ORIENTATION=+